VDEWEEFAGTIPAAASMEPEALRDDAKSILLRIADVMEQSQSDAERESKSRGEHDAGRSGADSAAQFHAGERLGEGFSLPDVVSEYRALRATVIRRWTSQHHPGTLALDELTLFNEGLDQALTESVKRFWEKLDRARELFMGALGHDLRTPLQIIMQCVKYLERPETATRTHEQMRAYIGESAEQIRSMVEDLLDVARTRLGGSLPISPASIDLIPLCCAAVDELRVAHPSATLITQVPDTLVGVWDAARLHQLLTNILKNALQHGDPSKPISLSVVVDGERVLVKIHNHGKPIPDHMLAKLFEPLARGEHTREDQRGASMGLGLYIANSIARAHRGSITVDSDAEHGTAFTVCLPMTT
jgi:signal transduction histidine kinase